MCNSLHFAQLRYHIVLYPHHVAPFQLRVRLFPSLGTVRKPHISPLSCTILQHGEETSSTQTHTKHLLGHVCGRGGGSRGSSGGGHAGGGAHSRGDTGWGGGHRHGGALGGSSSGNCSGRGCSARSDASGSSGESGDAVRPAESVCEFNDRCEYW